MLRRLRIESLVLIRDAELEFHRGLNAITGETGAGKTILAQAVGLLLGAKGDAAFVGPDSSEAYVEAELELPGQFLVEEELQSVAELCPAEEDGLVLARRVWADGRTRAYAWGRAVPREDLAAAAERLIAMSGQFEQRRLARPSYQLDVFDGFIGAEQLARRAEARAAWRALQGARRRLEELTRGAAAEEARIAELRALVEDTDGLQSRDEETLLQERERLRHITELADGASSAAEVLAPEDGDGAVVLAAAAERALAPLEHLAPELAPLGRELRDVEVRLRETASELRAFLQSLDAEPDRLDSVEGELARLADLKRRFRCSSYEELLERAARAREELDALAAGFDPVAAAEDEVRGTEARVTALADELRAARQETRDRFATAVAEELRGIGMGDGEFLAEVDESEPGSTGADRISFLIRPNPGLPYAPVAETASGGELSRIALALAAVSGGNTMIFDEIDAGIGGQTAHSVAETLGRLAERAQVITITHLPQIASVADRHFRVEKVAGDPTHTRIQELDDLERRDELERMLGGHDFLSALR
jgi:DNA repair protein RecN (Recombination protein N)